MYTLNTTIDDSSPLILYSPEGSWEQGNVEQDPELDKYWGKSYTHTFQEGAEAWFGFEGTGVTVFGARRDFRGEYTVRLDGQLVETSSAFVHGPGEFHSVLYSVTGLDQTRHTVVMQNSGNMSLDIDCIYWTAKVGEGSYKESPPQMLDDTQSAFTWSPMGAWTAPTNDLVEFMNATGHSTTLVGASVNCTFTVSDSVSVYGTIGPQNSRYTVQLDDNGPQNFSAARQTYSTQVLLFNANNLDFGEHSVIVKNEDPDRILQIDYALAFSDQATASVTSSTISSAPSSTSTYTSKNGGDSGDSTNSALVVGTSIASIIVLTLLLSLFLLLRRNKTLWKRLHSGYTVQAQFDPSYQPTTAAVGGSRSTRHHPSDTTTSHAHQPSSDQQPLMTEIRSQQTHQEDEHPPTTLVPNRLSHFVLAPNRPGQPSDYRPPPERSETQITASTLVAEHGSELGRSDSFVTKLSDAWARRRESPATTPTSGPRRSMSRRRLLVTDATHETMSPVGSDDEWEATPDLRTQVTDRSQSLESQPPGYWQSQATHSPIHGPLVDSSLHFNTPSSAHPGAQSSIHLAVYPSFRGPTSTESPV